MHNYKKMVKHWHHLDVRYNILINNWDRRNKNLELTRTDWHINYKAGTKQYRCTKKSSKGEENKPDLFNPFRIRQ